MRFWCLSILLLPVFILSLQGQDLSGHIQALQWRNIGPANMMGRIADIDASLTDYRHVLCASASGGVFLSKNGGITWNPIFDDYGAGSIGSVALHQQNPDIIWIGTGESANRNSSGWGDGLYRSLDGGESFKQIAFEDGHHIADIILHPNDPDIVYVAVVGHLWGYKGIRGLYKTYNGGQTWVKLTNGLPNDDKTGCTEIVMHPENPNILFAGFYHRLRRPYNYTSGGEQGGLFKSEDGGETWKKVRNGLPIGETGMIDLSICRKYPDVIVAAIETDENLPTGQPGSGVYRSDDGGDSWTFLHKHAVRPFYHGQIEVDPLNPDNIYVVSRDFQLSRDGGKTFEKRDWRVDGGDEHAMWIAPYDSNIFYLGTDQGLRLTVDGGANFLSFNNMAIGQYYAIGVDMQDPYWVGGGLQDNGLWIGPSNSREWRGILNEHNTWVGEGDGFHFQVDPRDWRTIYLVNHVGFAVRVNRETQEYEYVTPTPQTITNYQDHFDPNHPDTAINYTIDPGEHWFFYEFTDRQKLPPQFRFNWSSPLVLSPNNPDRVYFGGNHLFRSEDRGKSWKIVSPDLTGNDPRYRNPSQSGYLTRSVTGGENYYTIITVAESALDEQEIWVGTDDGYLHVSRNGGDNWTEVGINMKGVPRMPPAPEMDYGGTAWVSRVEPSKHQAGRCYVTLDHHRYDDMEAYVLVTEDYGQTWRRIDEQLPNNWSAYVVREDHEVEDLLFVGTEIGAYASLDRGENWFSLRTNMPGVAIHDLVIHPREGDLIAGTHGRSIWILDDISALRQMAKEPIGEKLAFLPSKTSTRWQVINTGRKQVAFEFRGQNPKRGMQFQFWLEPDMAGDSISYSVTHPDGRQSIEKAGTRPGLNRLYWNGYFPPSLEQGKNIDGLLRTLNLIQEGLSDIKQKRHAQDLYASFVALRQNYDVKRHQELWDELAQNYGHYGYPLSAKPRYEAAEPGTYSIELKYGELQTSGELRFRADPLLNGED
ncbi:MAG: hypothetical protein AAFP77_14115 [Bacteroidota bacterium]